MAGIEITGLKDLLAELRACETASVSEVRKALLPAARKVTTRAQGYAPEKSGKMKGSARAFATQSRAGVRFSHPGAGVQEFAVDYLRAPRGSGTKVGRSSKVLAAKGHKAPGAEEVHMVHVSGPPPRFAYRAVNELGPGLIDEVFEALVAVLECHGWFRAVN